MKFEARVTVVETGLLIVMNGMLDERAELPELTGVAGDLRIDMAGVTMLSSLGARNWMNWVKGLRVAGEMILVNCSTHVVKQFSILEGFLSPRLRVESIFVPYFCENCEREDAVVMNLRSDLDLESSELICPICGAKMILDMVKSQYFAFVKRHRSA